MSSNPPWIRIRNPYPESGSAIRKKAYYPDPYLNVNHHFFYYPEQRWLVWPRPNKPGWRLFTHKGIVILIFVY